MDNDIEKDKEGRSFLKLLNEFEPILRLIEVITVVIGTMVVSRQANRIAEMEMNINKKAIQPEFEVIESIEDDYYGNENVNAVLTISNIGGVCNNVRAEIICILDVVYFDGERSVKQKFQLDDFYFAKERTGLNSGIMFIARKEHNWGNYCKLSREVANNENILYGFTDIEKYLRLSYVDQLNEKHTLYYSFSGIYTELLDESVGEEKFQEYINIEKKVSLDEDTIDSLLIMLGIDWEEK